MHTILPDVMRCQLWACGTPTQEKCVCCHKYVCEAHFTMELSDMTTQDEMIFCSACYLDMEQAIRSMQHDTIHVRLHPLTLRLTNVAFMLRTLSLAAMLTASCIASQLGATPLAYVLLFLFVVLFIAWFFWCQNNLIEGVN